MRNELNTNFLKSLPIVAGCLGNKLGVTVEIGRHACTNGQRITIPCVIDEKAVTREEVLGLIVHEASHIRFTDMTPVDSKPLEFAIVNAIEDARIEKLITGIYAGAGYLLDKANSTLLSGLSPKICKMTPQNAYPLYAEFSAMTTYRPHLAGLRDKARRRCVSLLGEDVMKKADDILKDFPAFQSTKDVRDAASRLFQVLLDALPPEEDPDEPDIQPDIDTSESQSDAEQSSGGGSSSHSGQTGSQSASGSEESESGDSEEGQTSANQGRSNGKKNSSESSEEQTDEENAETGSGQSAQDGQSSSEEGANGSSRQKNADDGQSGGKQSSEDGQPSQGSGEPQESEQDSGGFGGKGLSKNPASERTANLKKAINATKQSIRLPDMAKEVQKKLNSSEQPDEPYDGDRFHSYQRVIREPKGVDPVNQEVMQYMNGGDPKANLHLIETAKAESVRTRKALAGIVQAKSREGAFTAASGRRIQLSRIARLTTGSPRIFERREEAVTPNTAVSILVDLSGSVDPDDRKRELIAALALHLALITIPKVKAELSVFPGNGAGREKEACVNVVPFGERPEKYRKSISMLTSWGSTPLKEALIQTSVTLSKRQENRKIIFVITDGMVDRGAGYFLERLRASGVETVGIQVGCEYGRDTFQELFPVSAVLDDYANLQPCLLDIAKRLLVKGIR